MNNETTPINLTTLLGTITMVFPLESYRRIMAYADVADTEISGFADLEYNSETKQFIVGDVYLLEQKAGGADVHMDEDAMAKFNFDQIKAGKMQLPRLWWHSHVDMGVFLSTTDEDTTNDLKNDTFNISVVVNKRHNIKTKGYISVSTTVFGETVEGHHVIEDIPVRVQYAYAEIPKDIVQEVKDKVTTRPAHTYSYPGVKGWFKGIGKDSRDEKFKEKWMQMDREEKILRLPKDSIAAAEKISVLELKRQWDTNAQDWGYIDPATGDIWVDYWESLDMYLLQGEKQKPSKEELVQCNLCDCEELYLCTCDEGMCTECYCDKVISTID